MKINVKKGTVGDYNRYRFARVYLDKSNGDVTSHEFLDSSSYFANSDLVCVMSKDNRDKTKMTTNDLKNYIKETLNELIEREQEEINFERNALVEIKENPEYFEFLDYEEAKETAKETIKMRKEQIAKYEEMLQSIK